MTYRRSTPQRPSDRYQNSAQTENRLQRFTGYNSESCSRQGSILILTVILILIRIGTNIGSKRPHILGQITQLSIIIFMFATITGTCQRISKSNLRIKPNYVHLITKPKIRLPPKFKSILSHLWLCDLISRSGDVHPNLAHDKLVPRSIPVAPANDLLKIEIRPSSVTTATFGIIYAVLEYPHQPTTLSLTKLLSCSANTAASQTLHPHFPVTNILYHIPIVMNTAMEYFMTTTMNNLFSDQTPKMHLPLNVKRVPRETHLKVFLSTPTA